MKRLVLNRKKVSRWATLEAVAPLPSSQPYLDMPSPRHRSAALPDSTAGQFAFLARWRSAKMATRSMEYSPESALRGPEQSHSASLSPPAVHVTLTN